MSFPEKTYDVVLADPPWDYYGSPVKWAAAGKHYPLMTNDQIRDLPVVDLLTKSGVVFLWATCPKLDFALEVFRDWGLYYRGVAFVWIKTKQDLTPIGAQGVRPSVVKPLTELVLVGSRKPTGRPLKLLSESVVQTVFAPRREHSRKPDEVKQRIFDLYGDIPRIELFARETTPGWDVWGNEVERFVAA